LLQSNGLLCDKTNVQSATFARSSRATRRTKSNFRACFERGSLDIAGKFDGFKIFRFHFAVTDEGRAALRAELRPVALIHSLKARSVP
jgi:hypothetical protein